MDNQQYTVQRSEQWHRERLGKFTSSKCHVFMAESKVKGEPNAATKTYIIEKLWELVSGHEHEINARSIEHGNEWEPFAKKMVQEKYKSEYYDVEFIQNPKLKYHGGSSDGFITINGIDTTPEIKCPVGKEQLVNIGLFANLEKLKKGYPELYWQCLSNMHLQGTKMALAVTFQPEGGDLMYKDIMIPYNEADVNLLFPKMAEGWEWMQEQAKIFGIDILAKYAEYATPIVKEGVRFMTPEQEADHFGTAA